MSQPLPTSRVLRFDLEPGFDWEDFELAVSKVFFGRMAVPEVGNWEGEVLVYIAKPPDLEELEALAQRCLDKCRIEGSFEIE